MSFLLIRKYLYAYKILVSKGVVKRLTEVRLLYIMPMVKKPKNKKEKIDNEKTSKLLVVVLALVLALSVVLLTACVKEETKTAYGLVHGEGYVCQATVVVKGETLVSADLIEACLPTYVKAETAIEGYTVEGTYSNHGSAATANFYKTVKFGDVTMTYDATLDGEYSKGYMVGDQTMLQFFRNEANCEKYFNAVANDEVAVVLATGNDTTILDSAALLKTENGYWELPQPTLWVGKQTLKPPATTL